MRHRIAHRKLGRVTAHRISMLRNQATALIRHERIETTVPRAKELRPFVERLITIAKRSLSDGQAPANRAVTARRLVLRDIQDRTVVGKLFDTVAPRFASRPGGYTRLLRLGYRRGDNAERAQVELVGSEYNPNVQKGPQKEAGETEAKPRTVGSRLRAAAARMRGKREAAPESSGAEKTRKPTSRGKSPAKAPRKKPE